jgi:excinuclease ABC subunit B
MAFKLKSSFKPAGDQPEAIRQLVVGLENNEKSQTLLGVTGSGKTFTIANVIQQMQRPTLILTHNKTLVAQLYGEFNQFFPENAVEYFVSYYDYYQPEAYIPSSDTFIEKDLSINQELEKLRLRTTSSLMTGRRDIIVVASISCIYGIGNPAEFKNNTITLKPGFKMVRNKLLYSLVDALYARTEVDFKRGTFRVKGDTVDVFPAYAEIAYRIVFFGDTIEEIESIDPVSNKKITTVESVVIFPANMYIAPKEHYNAIIHEIQDELRAQIDYYESIGKSIEAKRLSDRVNFDLEMIRELGYCSGIENYSRFLDRRKAGGRPFCLIDYFPDDFLLIIDESHATVPQIGAMYGGDRSRKTVLVDYGFRLPSALDNRPLNFIEFQQIVNQTIYVSATPGKFELEQCEGVVVDQVVRPTGLLDPPIEVRPLLNQVDDLLNEISIRVHKNERVLVTTLTKRFAEELAKYFAKLDVKCKYIHSDVDTLERIEILRDLRLGNFDVLIGVNLLREGLDLPEVSLVAILDADKEGFLRDVRSLTQTAGRAARNVNGLVIMYADKITKSMQATIDETERRRGKQKSFNIEHNITPATITKSIEEIFKQTSVLEINGGVETKYFNYTNNKTLGMVADPLLDVLTKDKLESLLVTTRKAMNKASKEQDFMEAARLRDEMFAIEQKIKKFAS